MRRLQHYGDDTADDGVGIEIETTTAQSNKRLEFEHIVAQQKMQ